MNNINTIDKVSYTPAKSNKLKNFGYGVMLLSLLNFSSPANAQSTTPTNGNDDNNVELPINLGNGLENQKKYNMPNIYKDKVYSFLKSDFPILGRGEHSTWMFTIDFALKEMESNWPGISKDDQWICVWHAILSIFGKDLIDVENEDPKKVEEFVKVFDKIEECGERYENGYLALLEKISADNQQRIDNAQERIDNAQERIDNAQERIDNANERGFNATHGGLNQLVRFYDNYRRNPNNIRTEEVQQMKSLSKEIIKNCKYYNIDYKTKLSPEVRKFYDIE